MQYAFFSILLLCSVTNGYAAVNDRFITIFSSSADDEPLSPELIVFDYLQAHLTDYNITQIHAGLDRSLQLLSSLNEGCIRNLVKNPAREQLFDFSLPATIFLSIKAYLSPRAASLVDSKAIDTISFVEFAIQHKLVVGIDKERSYGAVIDAELAKLPAANKYIKAGIESEDRMARMLFSNRIDLWLEYQTVMDLFEQQYLNGELLQSYYVVGANKYIYSHLACKKTAHSARFIEAINKILLNLYQQDLYYQAHIPFISDNLKAEFDAIFKQFLIEHSFNDVLPHEIP